MRLRLATSLALLSGAVWLAPGASAACDPFLTPPEHTLGVPSPEQVLGFPLGSRETTVEEIDRYLEAVDQASPRVTTGTLAVSWQGRPLRYALVSDPQNVTSSGVARVQRLMRTLRDPLADPGQAARASALAPDILWVAANVHGNEPSGADATLQTLYELADRSDCAATQILDSSLVVLLPTQNPDGRALNTRRNAYGFDLNRDWFARTQPETDGKVDALWQLPPQLFIDEHERGGPGYFFPPNADPIYHEIPDVSLDWIDHLYPPGIEAEFENEGFDYFHLDVYDLFYMGYGDSVPTEGWLAAGMTYEASHPLPYPYRTREHWVAQWASLTEGALNRQTILTGWHDGWVQAYQEGLAGRLEPNIIENPGHEVENPVPDITVRHYFIRSEVGPKRREVRQLIRRLQRMHVDVYRLTAPLSVPDYTPYGRPARSEVLPAGTWWIPMAQAQKHWVQAMLNEDTYVPFPYFYDVTAWSQPLLFNVPGGRSGAVLAPQAALARPVGAGRTQPLPERVPRIGLLTLDQASTLAVQSSGWTRYLLDQVWQLPYTPLSAADVAAGALSGVDVLVVSDGDAKRGWVELGPQGRHALRDWVAAGGRYVGWDQSTVLAVRVGLSAARLQYPEAAVPGTMFRTLVDASSPLAGAVGPEVYTYNVGDVALTPAPGAQVVVRYPDADSQDWFVSGYALGGEAYAGTAVETAEDVGAGTVVLFTSDPNFRAFTTGTQRLLRAAILARLPAANAPPAAPARVAAVGAAQVEASTLPDVRAALRIVVRPGDAAAVREALASQGAAADERGGRRLVTFLVSLPPGAVGDDAPLVQALAGSLAARGVRPAAFIVSEAAAG